VWNSGRHHDLAIGDWPRACRGAAQHAGVAVLQQQAWGGSSSAWNVADLFAASGPRCSRPRAYAHGLVGLSRPSMGMPSSIESGERSLP